MNMELTLTVSQLAELQRLKSHYPYRIIYGMIDRETQRFEAYAVTSMRIPNKLAREGHAVVIFK